MRSKAWKKYIDYGKPDLIITMSIGSLMEISYLNEYNIPIINSVNRRPDYDYSDILWNRSKKEMSLLRESYKRLSGIQILFDSYKNFLPETYHNKSILFRILYYKLMKMRLLIIYVKKTDTKLSV